MDIINEIDKIQKFLKDPNLNLDTIWYNNCGTLHDYLGKLKKQIIIESIIRENFKYKHIKTENIYDIINMNVINCNDDIQEKFGKERLEVLYSRNGKYFFQEKNEFLKKFKLMQKENN